MWAISAILSVATDTHAETLGEFQITFYCGCEQCNGVWAGYPTASGTELTAGRTVAVDPNVIPLGTEITIEGLGDFVAEDTGGKIKGKHIDVYMDDHEECLQQGVQYRNVSICSDEKESEEVTEETKKSEEESKNEQEKVKKKSKESKQKEEKVKIIEPKETEKKESTKKATNCYSKSSWGKLEKKYLFKSMYMNGSIKTNGVYSTLKKSISDCYRKVA